MLTEKLLGDFGRFERALGDKASPFMVGARSAQIEIILATAPSSPNFELQRTELERIETKLKERSLTFTSQEQTEGYEQGYEKVYQAMHQCTFS